MQRLPQKTLPLPLHKQKHIIDLSDLFFVFKVNPPQINAIHNPNRLRRLRYLLATILSVLSKTFLPL
ncbi:MAG: hypothetical protein FWB84_03575 [Candidatus Bathyarchaeota archaeon]|uniref:hypothetical protein n=1 Tax=Candidatus Bathycorpusculum sp. TaxID=2994959 RepID=UPI00282166EF|nr:hypothetical protein [Candidatus Termiticorpusculum sp.]MCL2257454.1 hypothetical protein [Candidatus Termiticorpusculum sp.]